MVLSVVYGGSAYPENAVFIQIAHILSPFWLLYPIQAHRFIVHVVPFSLIFFLKRIIKQILFSPCKRDIPARTGTLVHLSVPRLLFPRPPRACPKHREATPYLIRGPGFPNILLLRELFWWSGRAWYSVWGRRFHSLRRYSTIFFGKSNIFCQKLIFSWNYSGKKTAKKSGKLMIIRTIQKKNTSSGIAHYLRKEGIYGIELKEAAGQ